jgi:NADH-quinone oxidoreductase subunit J
MTSPFVAALADLVVPVVFWVLAVISVLAAIVAATAPRIVHAAFGLMGAFFGVAGIYALLGADFLALAQVIVYVGGILVLLVFGILLTARTRGLLGIEEEPSRVFPVLAGAVLLVGLLLAIHGTEWNAATDVAEPEPTTGEIGRAFLDPERFLVPFELASVLLLAALIGAAYLVRRRRAS